MTQEDKELSFIDISRRLHYGVIVNYKEDNYELIMAQIYPYFIITKVQSGQLIKIISKKFKMYSDCYDYAQRWFNLHSESYVINQFAIIKYVSQYEGKIITIFSNCMEISVD